MRRRSVVQLLTEIRDLLTQCRDLVHETPNEPQIVRGPGERSESDVAAVRQLDIECLERVSQASDRLRRMAVNNTGRKSLETSLQEASDLLRETEKSFSRGRRRPGAEVVDGVRPEHGLLMDSSRDVVVEIHVRSVEPPPSS